MNAPHVAERPEDQLYEEFSRLNNELMTTQRALTYRNAELLALTGELEARVAERTRKLEQSKQEIEMLAYAMAHDLRAPARHVQAFAAMLEESGDALEERQRRWISLMKDAARRQSSLIEDIIEYLHLSAARLEPQWIDVKAEVEAIAAQIDRTAPGTSWIVGDLALARGDPVLVRAILRRLLSNAAKFSAVVEAPTVTIRSYRSGNEIVFEVADNGVGFDAARAERLFQPFQRFHAEADFPGTGIGLAVCKRLVARHDGRIWAESAPGAGATLRFTLGRA